VKRTAAPYLELHRSGGLRRKSEEALALLENCSLCPRKCGVNRLRVEEGFCRTGRYAKVASHSPHFGEESPLVGRGGSGTIFFSSCNLLCSFCQNYDISHLNIGTVTRPDDLSDMMVQLERSGCGNINFVTPSHVVPQILEALPRAIDKGLSVPLVYNTGSYDSIGTIRLMEGVIDIYMPDFKFWESLSCSSFMGAADYPEVAKEALKEMHRQTGDLMLDEEGMAVRGLLVRHLVMPGHVTGTGDIMNFISREISRDTYVNLMDQYRPCYRALTDPLIARRITRTEYEEALISAKQAGIHRLDGHNDIFKTPQ